jgi:transposase
MLMKLSRCKIEKKKQTKLIEMFVAEVTARTAAELTGVNRRTAILFYHKLREIILLNIEDENQEYFAGEIELDESYFGGVRKGKRGRGAADKVAVFGILKRGGKVYTKVISDAKTETLLPIIKRKILPDSIVYTDCFRSYNVLDVSEFKHYRINSIKCRRFICY